MTEPSDEELMLAVRDGQLPAFDTLFRRHYEGVRGLCARIIGGGAEGDDLAQDTFLRVLRHRATFRGDARFRTWVFRIARNVCLEHIARRGRERKLAERWAVESSAHMVPESSADADFLALAMQSLTAEQREVLVLCRFHELPFSEIGEILGCTPGAARVRAHRALAELRQAYRRLSAGSGRRLG